MASKRFDRNSVMKNFIPEVGESEEKQTATVVNEQTTDSSNPVLPSEHKNLAAGMPVPASQTKQEKEKERTKPITFHMPESTNRRMMQYLYERKLAGEKITVTQILNDALLKYLDELGI